MLPVQCSPPPFRESVVNACWAGGLALSAGLPKLQLRVSTGLAPVSPFSLSIRGIGHPAGAHSIVNRLYGFLRRVSSKWDVKRGEEEKRADLEHQRYCRCSATRAGIAGLPSARVTVGYSSAVMPCRSARRSTIRRRCSTGWCSARASSVCAAGPKLTPKCACWPVTCGGLVVTVAGEVCQQGGGFGRGEKKSK